MRFPRSPICHKILAIGFLLSLVHSSLAVVIYAAAWGDDQLYQISPSTGEVLAMHPGVFGTDSNSMALTADGRIAVGGATSGLHFLDPSSGETELIAYDSATPISVRAIAVTSSGDAFGVSTDFDSQTSRLIGFNLATGLVGDVAALPFGIQSLASDSTGLLYGWNTQSGQVQVFDTSGGFVSDVFVGAENNVQAMDFWNGQLVIHRFWVEGTEPKAAFSVVDLTTGALEDLALVDPSLAISGIAISPIPEPSTLLLLTGGLLFFSTRRRRRVGLPA